MKRAVVILLLTVLHLAADCLEMNDEIAVGECYEREGNTNLAQAAYERALMRESDNQQARLKLAALYRSLQMQAEADAVLAEIDGDRLSPQQRSSLEALKRSAGAMQQFKARAELDFGYDDNINISPLSDDLLFPAMQGARATLFTRLKADASYLHDLAGEGGWFLRGDANLYYQNNASAHYYDALYGRFYAGGGYRDGNFALYVPLFYDRLNYLDRDLLHESGIRPELDLRLSNPYLLNLYAGYRARRYNQSSDRLRDDDIITAGVGLYRLKGRNAAYLKARYENYSATHDDPIAFTDKDLYYLAIGGLYAVGDTADIRLNYQYRYGDFAEVTAGRREDRNHDLTLALERDVVSALRLRAQYRYVDNRSNYEPADYTKNEFILGVAYTY